MDKNIKVFSISGMPVSGKSTVVKKMVEKFEEQGYEKSNIHLISVGKKFREYFNKIVKLASNINNEQVLKELAKDEEIKNIFLNSNYRKRIEKNIFLLNKSNFNFEEFDIKKANNSEELADIRNMIDTIVDNEIKQLGKNVLERNNNNNNIQKEVWIIDSRLAFNNIPDSYAVRCTVRENVAAQRLINDTSRGEEDNKYKSIEDAKNKVIERTKGELERYKKIYGVNLEDENNYNLIIDTSFSDIEEIVDTIIRGEEYYSEGKYYSKKWTSPKTLLPLQLERETLSKGAGGYDMKKMVETIKKDGYDPSRPIEIFEYDGKKYIYEGHHRNFASAQVGKTLVPYEEVKLPKEEVMKRVNTLNTRYLYGHEELLDKRDSNGNCIEQFSYNKIYPGIIKELKEKQDYEGR